MTKSHMPVKVRLLFVGLLTSHKLVLISSVAGPLSALANTVLHFPQGKHDLSPQKS